MLAEATDAVEDWAAEALPGTSDPEGSRLPLALAAPAAETGKRGGWALSAPEGSNPCLTPPFVVL